MLLKDLKSHHKDLILELEDLKVEQNVKDGESPYLVDYLYGISDVKDIVEDFLEKNKLKEQWILFYRCLIKKDIITKKEYYKLNNNNNLYFLVRNREDFEKWFSFYEHDQENSFNQEEFNNIVEKFSPKILDTEIKAEFITLLKHYFQEKENEGEKFEKVICELDDFLMKNGKGKDKNFPITKTDFMNKVLKISHAKLAKIKKI